MNGPGARPPGVSPAHVHRTWRFVELRFEGAVTQTRMLRWAPDLLWTSYTRSMLAALWLHPAPRRVGIIGLGGGAQPKFLHRHFPQLDVEVVENNAAVLGLREAFRVPADDARLRVVAGDGADWLQQRAGAFDVLLVDAYDAGGIPPHLGSAGFYADCHAALSADGVMAANLYDTDLRQHRAYLAQAFGRSSLMLPEPDMSNQVAFAWRGVPAPPDAATWLGALPRAVRWQLRGGVRRLARAWASH